MYAKQLYKITMDSIYGSINKLITHAAENGQFYAYYNKEVPDSIIDKLHDNGFTVIELNGGIKISWQVMEDKNG